MPSDTPCEAHVGPTIELLCPMGGQPGGEWELWQALAPKDPPYRWTKPSEVQSMPVNGDSRAAGPGFPFVGHLSTAGRNSAVGRQEDSVPVPLRQLQFRPGQRRPKREGRRDDGSHRPGVLPGKLTVAPTENEQADEESLAEKSQPGRGGDAELVSHNKFRVLRVTAAQLHEYLVISQGRR